MLGQALTYPQTCEYVFCHLLASFMVSHLAKVDAPWPRKPSVEHTKGVSDDIAQGKPQGASISSLVLVLLSL
jgi:hypothetical protein